MYSSGPCRVERPPPIPMVWGKAGLAKRNREIRRIKVKFFMNSPYKNIIYNLLIMILINKLKRDAGLFSIRNPACPPNGGNSEIRIPTSPAGGGKSPIPFFNLYRLLLTEILL
jgi:hypothetical protein